MADVYPAPVWPSSATIDALDGTTDPQTGLPYIAKSVGPSSVPPLAEQYNRRVHRLNSILSVIMGGLVVDESGLNIGVYPGNYELGGIQKRFAGATAQAVTNNTTRYVYVDSSNTLQIAASYPADITTYWPLATVVTSGGDITSITDDRGYALVTVPKTTSSSDTGTNNTSFILDEDNVGAAVDTMIRFNRGLDDAEDGAVVYDESADRIELRTQHSTGTLASLNLLALYVNGSLIMDANGAAMVTAAVAGNGLSHTAGAISVPTSSANGLGLDGSNNLVVDPSDGIALDANGVAVALTASGGLTLSGSAGSKTLGVSVDDVTVTLTSGAVAVKSGGLAPVVAADYAVIAGGLPVIFVGQIIGGNTIAIHNADAPFKYRILDAWSIAESADGGTWYLDNGTNSITDTVTVTGTDKTINRAGTIDDAEHDILASGTLRVVGDGALADCTVHVLAMRVA